MKKIISITLSCLIVLGGLGAVALKIENDDKVEYRFIEMEFSSIKLIENQKDYTKFSFENEEQYLVNPGQPLIPKVIEKIELPFGVRNIQIEVNSKGFREKYIQNEIEPAPSPIPKSNIDGFIPFSGKDRRIYNSEDLFPSSWYSYNVGCGLNKNGKHVTHLVINFYPYRYSPLLEKLNIINSAEISITYENSDIDIFPETSEYDLVIISPSTFQTNLEPLMQHKINNGFDTILKTTEEIYDEYDGVDKPEQIKYFIKDALETWNIKYVLLVGGLKSLIYAKARDNENVGEKGWHIPVRYSNLDFGDPGYACDLYYADIYKEGGEFENWDSNNDGIFARWIDNELPEDIIDLYPDVALGRLACRNTNEVDTVVNKIINYETTTYGSDWFKKMLVVSGDGFLDQEAWDFQWDTNDLPNGIYTIHAQSKNPDGVIGPEDVINITIDRSAECTQSIVTFNHDDHLNPVLADGYPADPIAEIVSVSNGDILSQTNVEYTPHDGEAYCNELFWWANVSYVDGVLTIRGKGYDPKPYGNITDIHAWVENEAEEVIYSIWKNNTKTYYEGEWVTGAESVLGRGGALYYMPDDFDVEIAWTSNGKYANQQNVIDIFSEGYGFSFFSGHGSPGFWGDHTPGIPGNRAHSQLTGLVVSNIRFWPQFPFLFISQPLYPMEELSNNGKLPITVVGGCYNAQFTVSAFTTAFEYLFLLLGEPLYMHSYGDVVPECWCWYMVKMPETGSIATIGNTGTGWGWEGEFCTIGAGDGWISSEFFRQYGDNGYDILGDNYLQTQTEYISQFREFILPECWWYPDTGWDIIDEKTVQQWVLLGDPSLKIGGYE